MPSLILILAQIMTLLRKNFIKIFFGGNKTSIVRQITHTVEALQRNASTKPIWDGVDEANQLAIDCLKSFKNTNWVENSQMSEDNQSIIGSISCGAHHLTNPASPPPGVPLGKSTCRPPSYSNNIPAGFTDFPKP